MNFLNVTINDMNLENFLATVKYLTQYYYHRIAYILNNVDTTLNCFIVHFIYCFFLSVLVSNKLHVLFI